MEVSNVEVIKTVFRNKDKINKKMLNKKGD